ncbi:hypothetical protein [Salegentibacter chungangensis]|uniref:Phosphatidate cytidylyltransferase n=1 Tax=Salegentibacter chungangensis TaxID=1335724 RepID=A0ABW3NPA1_9FLAO
MKKTGFIILAALILGAILYLTFVLAVIKLLLGIILLLAAGIVLWFIWNKIKDKVEDKF